MTTPPWCREKVMVYYYYSYGLVFSMALRYEFHIFSRRSEWILYVSLSDIVLVGSAIELDTIIIRNK